MPTPIDRYRQMGRFPWGDAWYPSQQSIDAPCPEPARSILRSSIAYGMIANQFLNSLSSSAGDDLTARRIAGRAASRDVITISGSEKASAAQSTP